MNRMAPRALLALLGGVIGIGFAPVLVRLSGVGPSATASWRVLLALPLLWLLVLRSNSRTDKPPPNLKDGWLIVGAGLLFTGDLALWHWSLLLTTVANSTLFSNFAPLLVTLGAFLFFREKITRLFLAGLALALVGSGLLLSVSGKIGSHHLLGDLLAFSTAIFYAGYLLSLKILRRHRTSASIMAWTGLVSGPSFMLIAAVSGETLWPADARAWSVLLALALISHVGGQTLIAYAIGHLPASFSALTLLLQPLVAAILAWAVLGESLASAQIIGGMITLAGICLAARATLPAPQPPVPPPA